MPRVLSPRFTPEQKTWTSVDGPADGDISTGSAQNLDTWDKCYGREWWSGHYAEQPPSAYGTWVDMSAGFTTFDSSDVENPETHSVSTAQQSSWGYSSSGQAMPVYPGVPFLDSGYTAFNAWIAFDVQKEATHTSAWTASTPDQLNPNESYPGYLPGTGLVFDSAHAETVSSSLEVRITDYWCFSMRTANGFTDVDYGANIFSNVVHLYLAENADSTLEAVTKRNGASSWGTRLCTIEIEGDYLTRIPADKDFTFPNEQPTSMVVDGNDVVLTFDNVITRAMLNENDRFKIVPVWDHQVLDEPPKPTLTAYMVEGSVVYGFTDNVTISFEASATYTYQLPTFRYWMDGGAEVAPVTLAPSPPKAQDFGGDGTGEVELWAIGDDGYYLTFYQATDGDEYLWSSPLHTIVTLRHAENPDLVLQSKPIPGGTGQHLRIWWDYMRRKTYNDDGVFTAVGCVDPGYLGAITSVAWSIRIDVAIVEGEPDLVFQTHQLPDVIALSRISWSAHTNDGGSEFVVYTSPTHPDRPFHVIAYNYVGHELWSSPTPPFNGPGVSAQDTRNRNNGQVVALPKAGRFVWHNQSSDTWYVAAQQVSWSTGWGGGYPPSPYNTRYRNYIYANIQWHMPEYDASTVQNSSMVMRVTVHSSTPSVVTGLAFLDMSAIWNVGKQATPYFWGDMPSPGYYTTTRGHYESWAGALWGPDTSPVSYGEAWTWDVANATYDNFTWLDEANHGTLNEAFSYYVWGDNSACKGGRLEIRGADDLLINTATYAELTGSFNQYQMYGSGEALLNISTYYDPIGYTPGGDPIYREYMNIGGVSFVDDQFAAWPNHVIEFPEWLSDGNAPWDLYKGQIAVAFNFGKRGTPT
jgi:hypothetical protein